MTFEQQLDNLLFNLRHWQMFLITLAIVFLNAFLFLQEPGWRGIVGDILPAFLSVVWLMLLGIRMRTKLSQEYKTHFVLFILTGCLMVILVFVFSIFKQDIIRQNFGELPIILTIVAGFLMGFTFIGFIARAIKALETNDRATVSDYAGDVFLWGMWWVGVWILAPRLNRLYDKLYRN